MRHGLPKRRAVEHHALRGIAHEAHWLTAMQGRQMRIRCKRQRPTESRGRLDMEQRDVASTTRRGHVGVGTLLGPVRPPGALELIVPRMHVRADDLVGARLVARAAHDERLAERELVERIGHVRIGCEHVLRHDERGAVAALVAVHRATDHPVDGRCCLPQHRPQLGLGVRRAPPLTALHRHGTRRRHDEQHQCQRNHGNAVDANARGQVTRAAEACAHAPERLQHRHLGVLSMREEQPRAARAET